MQLQLHQQQASIRGHRNTRCTPSLLASTAAAAAAGVCTPCCGRQQQHRQQQQRLHASSSAAAAGGKQGRSSTPRAPLATAQRPDAGMAAAAADKQQQQHQHQHTEQEVSFLNQDGQRLSGLLTLCCGSTAAAAGQPEDAPPAQSCLILCHGYASCRDGFQLPKLAAALADAGFNSLRFDFAGNGASEGAFRLSRYEGEAADIAAAKAHLEGHHGQRVAGLLGHSKAGDVVVLYSARHADIPRVINVAGRYDLREGVDSRFGADIFRRVLAGPVSLPAQRDDGVTLRWQLTKEDLDERLTLDMPATTAQVPQHIRVLTIHGTADTVIPVTDGHKFAAALPGNRLVEVDGADHNFRTGEEHVRQLVDAVVGFFAESD